MQIDNLTPESEMDPGILEMLQDEFMAMLKEESPVALKAIRYAMDESPVFNSTATGVVYGILKQRLPGQGVLNDALSGYVAPLWAREQYDKRLAELEEIKAEQEVT